MRINTDESMDLVDFTPLSNERQVEIEIELTPGRYIVVPRTSGALMIKPDELFEKPKTALVTKEG